MLFGSKLPGSKSYVSIRRYYPPSNIDTIEKLAEVYAPILRWLKDNIKNEYTIYPMDNVLYSDISEDTYIGYVFGFEREEDAIFFKMIWLLDK